MGKPCWRVLRGSDIQLNVRGEGKSSILEDKYLTIIITVARLPDPFFRFPRPKHPGGCHSPSMDILPQVSSGSYRLQVLNCHIMVSPEGPNVDALI